MAGGEVPEAVAVAAAVVVAAVMVQVGVVEEKAAVAVVPAGNVRDSSHEASQGE